MESEKIIKEIQALYEEGKNFGIVFEYDYKKEAEEWKDDYESLVELRDEIINTITEQVFKKIGNKHIMDTYYDTVEDSGIGIFDRSEDFVIEYYPSEREAIIYVTLVYGANNSMRKLEEKYSELLSKFNSIGFNIFKLKHNDDKMIIKTQWDIQPRQYTEIVLNHNENKPFDIEKFEEDIEKILNILLEWVTGL